MSIRSSADIAAELNEAEKKNSLDLNTSEQVIGQIMSKWPNDRGIFVQLQRLADYIAKTREELSTLRPDQVKHDFLPKATDELDAIVEATASATHGIMDAADVIMDLAGRMAPGESEKAVAAVTAIYEACTFQDITGQRVTKVVNMLKTIEGRIDKMIEAMGELESASGAAAAGSAPPTQSASSSQGDIDALFSDAAPSKPSTGQSELHGPALPGQGHTQADIDALFSGGR